MLDVRLLRSDPDAVRAGLEQRGAAHLLDPALTADERRRAAQTTVDGLRAERNAASEAIGAAMKAAKADPAKAAEAEAARAAVQELKERLATAESDLAAAQAEFDAAMLAIPNLPHPKSPRGDREEDAEVLRVVGHQPTFAFAPRDHIELAGAAIDMERGARTSGARFGYLLGDVARLWWAIQQFAIATLVAEGFTPVLPPVLVRREALVGTGFFPGDEQMIYRLDEFQRRDGDEADANDLYLVGTSEVPLASLHATEILDEDALPLRYCGMSACFRREAGAAGRDTRGIFRTHQFEKVEMFVFTTPDASWDEHERLLAIEERIAQGLGLHYRVADIAAGDLGASAARKYDIEVWLPGQDRYRELTSCSNTTDYQARRLDARFRPRDGGTPRTLHTLNGTAATSSRTVIAVLETHQQEDGSIAIPEALRPFGLPATICGPT